MKSEVEKAAEVTCLIAGHVPGIIIQGRCDRCGAAIPVTLPLSAIRDLLMPGLRDIIKPYALMNRMWSDYFDEK